MTNLSCYLPREGLPSGVGAHDEVKKSFGRTTVEQTINGADLKGTVQSLPNSVKATTQQSKAMLNTGVKRFRTSAGKAFTAVRRAPNNTAVQPVRKSSPDVSAVHALGSDSPKRLRRLEKEYTLNPRVARDRAAKKAVQRATKKAVRELGRTSK